MHILKYEYYKLFCKKFIILLILFLFSANIYLYINEQRSKDLDIPESYEALSAQYSRMPVKEALLKADSIRSDLGIISSIVAMRAKKTPEDIIRNQIAPFLSSGENKISYEDFLEKYKDSKYMEDSSLLEDYSRSVALIRDQLEYIAGYPDFISSMEEKAKNMQSVSVFNKPGTFAYRNIIKTPEDFRQLKAIELKLGDETGIVSVARFKTTDIIMVTLIFLFCIYIFLHEKENGLISLTKSASNGHSPVILSKLAVLVTISAVLSAVFYGSILMLGSKVYGFGDVSRHIQSMKAFRDCSILLTVKEYIVLFILSKLLVAMFTSLICAMFFNLLSSAKVIYTGLGLFAGISYFCYNFIHPASYVNVLKYLNIFAFFDVYKFYGEYVNINLIGYPVSKVLASMLVIIVLSCFAAVTSIMSYIRFYAGRAGILGRVLNRLTFRRKRLLGHTGLFLHEAQKVFVTGKVYLIIIIALAIGYSSINTAPLLMSKNASVYKGYVDSMAGKVTDQKVRFIQEEQKRFDNIPSQLQKLRSSLESGSIDNDTYSAELTKIQLFSEEREGFDRFKNQYGYLVRLKKEENIDGSFICQLSSGYIFDNPKRDLSNAILYSILLILCLSSVFPIDTKNGMDKVLKCTRLGRLKLFLYKYSIGYITALLLMVIVYLPYYINLLTRFDIGDWRAPIQSVSSFENLGMNISVRGFLVLTNLLQAAGCCAMVSIVLLVSQYVKKQPLCILSSTILFVFPLIIKLMGVSSLDFLTLNNNFLQFTVFSKAKSIGGIAVYFVVLVLLSVLAAAFGGFRHCLVSPVSLAGKLRNSGKAVAS